MFELTQNLAARTAAGAVGFVMAVSLAFGAYAVPTAQADELSDLLAQIAALQAQLNGLQDDASSSAATATGNGYIHHPNVDFMFNTNLRIGARGTDVMMLQKALNDGGYTVATSGAGSAGNETEYFGPATTNAVIAFQRANNISPAIGNFYPLTRAEMNRKGSVSTDTGSDSGSSSVDGDALEVEAGDQPDADKMYPGVVRLPITTFELSAGDEDVTVDSLTFELDGGVDRSNFESVVLLDEDGNIFGDEESIDSDDEVEFNEEFEVEAGETVVMTLAVNADTSLTDDGDEFTFFLIEVDADADVDGLPIEGSEVEVDTDNDEIDGVTVEIDHETTSDLEIGSEDELVMTLTISSDDNNNDDDESVYVKSLRIENQGTVDLEDLADVYIEADSEDYDAEVDGDYLVFDFGNGVEIENDDQEDFEVYVTVTADADAADTIVLEVSESADLYVETEDGYGAPITVDDTDDIFPVKDSTNEVTIQAGSARLSTSSEDDAEDVVAGDDVLLGQFDFEIEGEGIMVDMLTLTITVTSATTTSGDADDLLLEDVYITDADGNVIVSTEDAEGTTPFTTQTVEFEDIEFPKGDHEDLRILATINDEVGDGTEYEISTLTVSDFDGVEGEESDEDVTITGSASFSSQEISGSVLEVSVSDGEEDETSDDVEEFVFAILELDASDSGEDVEVTSVELQVTASTTQADAVEDISSCGLYMDDDLVSNTEDFDENDFTGGVAEYDFDLDDVVAASEGGDATELELRCDIADNDLVEGDSFTWEILATADVDAEGVDTNTDGDDFVEITASAADTVTIVAADLDVRQSENFDEDKVVKDDEDGVVLLEVEVEGVDGTATIDDITGTLAGTQIDAVQGGDVDIYVDGNKEGEIEFAALGSATEESLNIEIAEDETVTVQFRVDIDANANSGDTLVFTLDTIVLEDGGDVNGLAITSSTTTIFEAVPVIELESNVTNDLNITNVDYELFQFTVEADGEDLTVDSVTIDVTEFSNINSIDTTLEVYRSDNFGGTPVEEVDLTVGATGSFLWDFTDFEIDENDKYYFVLIGDVTASADPAVITLEIKEDATGVVFTTVNSEDVLEDDLTVSHSYTD